MYNAYVIGTSEHSLLFFERDSQDNIRDVVFGTETLKSECIVYDLDEAQAIIEDLETNFNKFGLHIYQLGAVKEIV